MPCMYDSWDLHYKFPFGAIRRRSDCNFTIYLPAGVTPDFPSVMVLFRTGFKERFHAAFRSCRIGQGKSDT